jgi:hypothetical protein
MIQRVSIKLALTFILLLYAGWTAFMMFVFLLAESGGKNSQPWLAAMLLLPLGEAVFTWWWLVRKRGESFVPVKKWLPGGSVLTLALFLPTLLIATIFRRASESVGTALYVAATVICFHVGRYLLETGR